MQKHLSLPVPNKAYDSERVAQEAGPGKSGLKAGFKAVAKR